MQRSILANSRVRALAGATGQIPVGELQRWTAETMLSRPARAPDYRAENQAFIALACQMADNPAAVLQTVAELVVDLCGAGSAGISILELNGAGDEMFRWVAVAGQFAHHLGGVMPRNASPCGLVVDLDAFLMFEDLVERFPVTADLDPKIAEVILAPFHVRGRAVGTVWALSHDPDRRFMAEDMRLLVSVASFASLQIFAPPVGGFSHAVVDKSAQALASLTLREKEILNRLLQGQPNKIIAADLSISQRTAEHHRAAIMKKMGVSSLAALVQIAVAGLGAFRYRPSELRP